MPARPISSATVSFGLVSVPVHLYSAGESEGAISFNWLDKKDGRRLKQQYVNQEGQKVEKDGANIFEIDTVAPSTAK